MFRASATHHEEYSTEKHAPHTENKRFSEKAHRYKRYAFSKTCIVLAWTIKFANKIKNDVLDHPMVYWKMVGNDHFSGY